MTDLPLDLNSDGINSGVSHVAVVIKSCVFEDRDNCTEILTDTFVPKSTILDGYTINVSEDLYTNGLYLAEFVLYDNAGNMSSTMRRFFKVDKTAPTSNAIVTINGTPAAVTEDDVFYTQSPVLMPVGGTDDTLDIESGIKNHLVHIYSKNNEGEYVQIYNLMQLSYNFYVGYDGIEVPLEGFYKIVLWSLDYAGNKGESSTFYIAIDNSSDEISSTVSTEECRRFTFITCID